MKIITTIAEMQDHSDRLRHQGDRIGFVPTMGFLHEGHLSLMRRAREENQALVVSIFVNPTQFGPDEDYDSYPRDLEKDASLCREVGCDVLFTPGVDEMYPQGSVTTVSVAGMTETLCGASRPGHFDGVTTVVCKLFNIVRPHAAYFGLKDYQQYRVLFQMVYRASDYPGRGWTGHEQQERLPLRRRKIGRSHPLPLPGCSPGNGA
jgi:pantoate--beta-alanine ligase